MPKALHSALPPPDRAALFLDFDGTLVDIAQTPDAISVPSDLVPLLCDLEHRLGGAVAVVSGRHLDDLERFLAGFDGPLIGGHGAELRLAATRTRHPLASSPTLAEAQQRVIDKAQATSGLLAERKPTGIVLHYRTAPERADEVASFMAQIVATVPGAELHRAKMAVELRPDDIGKDQAVAQLLKKQAFTGRRPVFFGDDATDEPAMHYVQVRGGVACKVGDGETNAILRARSPLEVRRALALWQ